MKIKFLHSSKTACRFSGFQRIASRSSCWSNSNGDLFKVFLHSKLRSFHRKLFSVLLLSFIHSWSKNGPLQEAKICCLASNHQRTVLLWTKLLGALLLATQKMSLVAEIHEEWSAFGTFIKSLMMGAILAVSLWSYSRMWTFTKQNKTM